MTSRTLPWLFETSVQRFSSNILIREKHEGAYRSFTYAEIREAVLRCAAGLHERGIKSGERIALLSEGRKEWVIAELGILYNGSVNVPLSVRIDEPADLEFRLSHAGCRMAIASGSQAGKIRQLRARLPALEELILLDDPPGERESSFEGLLELGERWLATSGQSPEELWQEVREADPATISYTSGTVADPKGIVLTHRNYTANIAQSTAMFPLPPWASTLLILPWDHAFAHTDGIYALLSTGGSFACVQAGRSPLETLKNIPANIREVRPTFLLSVPALAKNFQKGILSAIRSRGRVVEALFWAGLKLGEAYHGDGVSRGKGWRLFLRPLYALLDRVLFRKVRENFGGRLEYFIGGGALLDIELQRFFFALGLPMYQGYGLTEASPVISANTPSAHRLGSSGMIVPDLELRICDGEGQDVPPGAEGEIVVRGENVMAGYWMNEKASRQAVRDGWLHTGDLGYMDQEGYLHVLGREKSLLIGHDGEKYSPEGIEETIVGSSRFIDQLMLYNNQSPYTVALLVPRKEALKEWAEEGGLHLDCEEGRRAALREIESEFALYRPGGKHARMFPQRWIPTAFAVLSEPFTEQNRLLNSTMKMVRGKIEQRYHDRLTLLHSPEGKKLDHPLNLEAIGKL
jgi:long-chain acyl-CoA synthetase